MKKYCIYKHTSPSGKSYIGQTSDYIIRTSSHLQGNSTCRLFSNAIKKYGWNNFTHDILIENLSIEEATKYEEFYISEHNTLAPNGYNLTSGGLNYIRSEETKQLISSSRLGQKRNPLVVERINKNPEKIRKTAEKHLGMKRSKESKQRMSKKRIEILKTKGGALNKGMKMFYNPLNTTEKIQCFPINAPVGWINGNPAKKGKIPYKNVITNKIKWFIKNDNTLTDNWIIWNPNKKDIQC